MRNLKRIKTLGLIAVILLFCLVVCVISTGMTFEPAIEYTMFSGGDGTQALPYLLSNVDDFVALMNGVNDRTAPDGYFGKHFQLAANIDLSGITMSPIGDFTYPFKGRLDGGGYKIAGLYINVEDGAYIGLFGVISADAIIENLSVSGAVNGLSDVGGIVGLNNGRIANCVNSVNVSSIVDNSAMDIGGICGYNKGIIENSYNAGVVVGHGVNTGGIAGLNSADLSEALIRNCFNIGAIESDFYGAGGIAGHNDGIITECFNSAKVLAYSTAGGIVGSNIGIIENSYNTNTVGVTNKMAGGIAGSSEGAIYNVYNLAEVNASSLKGGICGFVSVDAVLETCFLSSDAFSGKMTNRGNEYPNSAILRDVDMASADVLTNNAKMKALANGRGEGKWSKRAFDNDYCYSPEITVFSASSDEKTTSYSKESTKIKRATAEVTLDTLSYVYDGTAHEPEILLGDEKLIKGIDYLVVYSDNINAGTACATITFINYFTGVVEKNYTITKSPITVMWQEMQFTYNGKVQYPVVDITSGCVDGEEITFLYTGFAATIGEHTVTATLAENSINANYSFEAESNVYEIKPAELTISWSEKVLVYDGTAQYPIATVTGGIIEGDTLTLTYSGYMNNIDAAEGYIVTVSLSKGGDNDNYTLNEKFVYKIAKRVVSVTFENITLTYNGKAQYPKVATVTGVVKGEELTFVYSGYEDNITVGDGYTVYAQLAANEINANYEMAITECVYSIMEKAITITFSDAKLIFNGVPQCPSFTVNGLLDDDEIDWVLSDYSANINASVGGAYYLTVSLRNGSDYVFEPVTIRYDISPMPISIAWKDSKLVYSGNIQRPDAEVITETPTAVGLIYADYIGVDAGQGYSIVITTNSTNYIIENTLTYDIFPKEIKAIWTGNNFVYNGIEQYPSVKFDGIIDGDNIETILIKTDSIRSGRYDIKAEINNQNYVLNDTGVNYEILPKSVVLDELTAEDKVYDGKTDIVLCGGKLNNVLPNDEVDFVLGTCMAEGSNAGIWRVRAEIVLTGEDADCYVLVMPEIFVRITKAKFNTDILQFNTETFAYDGKAKSLKIEGNLPDCISIEYIGNDKTEVGEYIVVARFTDTSGNYELIPDVTAKMYISKSAFSDEENNVKVEVENGVLPFDAEVKIEKSIEWSGEFGNKRTLSVYDINLLHKGAEIQPNGKLKILLMLDEETLNAKGLILLHVGQSGVSEELTYYVEGNSLVFYTDSLSEFVLMADKQISALWLGLTGVIGGVLLITAITLFIIMNNKKRQKICATNQILDSNELTPATSKDLSIKQAEIRQEVPFELDGIKCAGKASLLASLCFKNTAKQKEVACMSATKAQAHAKGKGGNKRRELYWQGKRIIKDSVEYVDLLHKADEIISEIQTEEQWIS